MTSANAEGLDDLYVTQRLSGGKVHDVTRNPMSQKYPDQVKTRVTKVVAHMSNMSMPFVEWGLTKETYVLGQATRLHDRFAFPSDL